jgi:hypothetical protein
MIFCQFCTRHGVNAGTALLMVGLALMVGGMLALGAFTAPTLFKMLPRSEAGAVMATIFHRYDSVLMVALVLVLLGEGLRFLGSASLQKEWLQKTRWILLLALVGMAGYTIFSLTPTILEMQQTGFTPTGIHHSPAVAQAFNEAHHLSESLYKLELLAALLLILLTPFEGAGAIKGLKADHNHPDTENQSKGETMA